MTSPVKRLAAKDTQMYCPSVVDLEVPDQDGAQSKRDASATKKRNRIKVSPPRCATLNTASPDQQKNSTETKPDKVETKKANSPKFAVS